MKPNRRKGWVGSKEYDVEVKEWLIFLGEMRDVSKVKL